MADIPENKTLHMNEESSVQIAHSVLCKKKYYIAQLCAAQASVNSIEEFADLYIEGTINYIYHSRTILRHLFVYFMSVTFFITLKLFKVYRTFLNFSSKNLTLLIMIGFTRWTRVSLNLNQYLAGWKISQLCYDRWWQMHLHWDLFRMHYSIVYTYKRLITLITFFRTGLMSFAHQWFVMNSNGFSLVLLTLSI